MIKVNYPEPEFRIKKEDGREMIFDSTRKLWVVLTDEEWVRQNFIQYMVKELHYPGELIAVEKEIKLGELKKRFDILLFNKLQEPWMMIECKSSNIELSRKVFDQLLRYHISVPATYLIITNGNYTFGWFKKGNILEEISDLPAWPGKNE